jgi:hypothetical protein
MTMNPGPLTGAPISQDGGGVTRAASGAASGPTLPGAGKYLIDTAPATDNFVTLPPLESLPGGSEVTIFNISGANALTVNASGTEQINGAGAPGSLSIPAGESRTFTADRGQTAPLVFAASWWSQAS